MGSDGIGWDLMGSDGIYFLYIDLHYTETTLSPLLWGGLASEGSVRGRVTHTHGTPHNRFRAASVQQADSH